MRGWTKSAVVFVGLTFLSGGASAAVIEQSLTGVVSGQSTVDTYGLFGPPGADLSGAPINIYFNYNTGHYTHQFTCGTNCTSATAVNHNPSGQGSTLIAVAINGLRPVVYVPEVGGKVIFQNATPTSPANVFSVVIDPVRQTVPGSMVSVLYTNPTSFGGALAPSDPPVLNNNADTVTFYVPSDSNPGGNVETLSFLIKKAGR